MGEREREAGMVVAKGHKEERERLRDSHGVEERIRLR